ncbi:MAG: MFS transporter [Proteobacteria bacterium]|nr:MFS transporter [Pseudomonadota bacterium]
MSEAAAPGLRVLFVRPNGAYLATFSLGSALYAFAAFLVAACMPSAVQVLGHLDLISWGFTFYLIAAIVAGTVAAPMKRRFGTAQALQGAAVSFLAGTLACALAPDMWVLLAGRVIQGLGEGAISGLIYMLIPEVFPPLLIPAIFGVEAVIWASGSTIGPIVGGFLTQTISWRAAFLVEAPLVLLFMLLVSLYIPRRPRTPPVEPPVRETLPLGRLLGVGLAILILSVAAIEPALWMRGASMVVALGLLAVLARRDATALSRLLPRGAFTVGSTLGLAFWVVLLMSAANTGPATYEILLLERIWGFHPLAASILGAATYVTWSVSGIVVSRLPPRYAPTLLWLGPLVLASGLAVGTVAMTIPSLGLLLGGLILVGIGYGLSWGFLSQAIMTGAGPGDGDRASAMLPTVLSMGLAIGAALGGLAANTAGLTDGASAGTVAQAGLLCFAVATVVAIPGVFASLRLGRLAHAFAPAQ